MAVTKICEVCRKEFSVPECRAQTAKTWHGKNRRISAVNADTNQKSDATRKK